MPNHQQAAGTLAEQAHQMLEELIVTLELEPGSVWSELSLAERLGIGRTPVREAVQRLAAAHLVEIVPRHGIMITKPNIHEQLLVLETRRELERLIAKRAARRALPSEREQMRAAAQTLTTAGESGDVRAYLRALYMANQLMGQLARNQFAANAIAPLHALSRRFYFVEYQQLSDLKKASQLHAAVTNAIASGEEGAAARAVDAMMDYIDAFTKACLTRDFEPNRDTANA
jgi:DNA-binding GntR family transcriptional regulator